MDEKSLPEKMIIISDRDNLPINHLMRTRAKELNDVLNGTLTDVKSILGSWARARKVYCDYTHEDLI